MNYITFTFSTATTGVIIVAAFVNFLEKQIPALGRIFRYGKCSIKEEKSFLNKFILEVPKSTFRQFYWTAVIIFTYVFYQVTSAYIFENDVPQYVFKFLDVVSGKGRQSQLSATHIYVVVCLMTLQVYRRFYDTNYISVFSKNGKINVIHYIIGMLHYPGVAIALLCEAPKFTNNTKFASNNINWSELTYTDYFAIILFLWAWYHQHTTSKILANLRKNKKGEVVTNEHKLPFGDWFEYLSCPHQIAEVLMYTSITMLLVYHITWFFVWAWVVVNQIETIRLSHLWYESTFKNFPGKRKMLIPFVY